MLKNDTFYFEGERWICRESYKNGLYLAQIVGTDDMKYFHRVNGVLDCFCVKFTPENVDVGTNLTPVFNLGRFTVLSINDGKATISVCYPTPDGRIMERKFKLTFSTFLKKANSAFVITPTEEDLPADGRFLRPSNDPNWKFRITKDYGNGDVFVEIFYCEERIDTKRMNRITLAGYMNTPFEFGEPEMKGKEKMTTDDKFPAHSDVIKRLIDCRKEIEDIVKNCKNPLDRLLDDDMPWRKQVDVLNANLPKGYSIKPQIVETGFAEDLKDGLHKD